MGPGTVTLTGSNGYTGPTVIQGGTLGLGVSDAIKTSSIVYVENNGVLDISGNGGNQTIHNLLSNQTGGTPQVILGANTLTDVVDGANLLPVTETYNGPTVFGGVISGTGQFVKHGSATLVLTGNNTYSGGTVIGAGTLQLGGQGLGASAANNGTLGKGDVTDNGALLFTEPNDIVFANTISGSGTVQQSGPGVVTLAGSNTYSGGTTIDTGTVLKLGSGTNGTLGSGGVTANGSLVFTEPNAASIANVISGSGGIEQSGPGVVTLTGANTYTGATIIDGGTTLQLGNGTATGTLASASAVSIGTAGTLVFNQGSNTGFANVISGTGGVTQSGPGSVTLTGVNTFTGQTTVTSGTLAIGAGGSIAGSSAVQLQANNGQTAGRLDISAGGQTINNLSSAQSGTTAVPTVVLGGNTLTVNTNVSSIPGNTVTFGGVISGTGALVKIGVSTMVLTGTNTYSGGTTISQGTLQLGGQAQGAASATTGTLGSGPVVTSGDLVFNEPANVVFANAISGAGSITQQGTGSVTLTGANSYTGTSLISAGSTLVLAGGTLGSSQVFIDGTLQLAQPTSFTLSNPIYGAGTLLQSGPGTVTIDTAQNFNGLTHVAAGTLVVGSVAGNGASIGGSVTVDAGATLAGYGALGVLIPDPPVLTNSGTVIPGGASGNAPGVLYQSGDYVQTSVGKLLIAVTPTTASQLQVGGASSLAGTIAFAYAPGTYTPKIYTVLSSAGPITGTFGTVQEQGSVPTTLNRAVQYVATTSAPGQVNLVLTAAPLPPTPETPSTPSTPTPPSVIVPIVIVPYDDPIYSESLASRAASADNSLGVLLGGGDTGNDCSTIGVPPVIGKQGSLQSASDGLSTLGRVLCAAGGWVHANGTFPQQDGAGNLPSYHSNIAGFLAGLDRQVTDFGLRLGVATGYEHRKLYDALGGNDTGDVARFGVYALQQVDRLRLDAAFLYGHSWLDTNRVTGVGNAKSSNGGNEFSGGVQASMGFAVGNYTLTPLAGMRVASVAAGSFAESMANGLSAYAVSGNSVSQTSIIPYARLVASTEIVTGDGKRLAPYVSAGYQYQAGDTQRAVTLIAADGTVFGAPSANPDRSAASLGLGFVLGADAWSVFAGYGALLSGNWHAQEVNAGVKLAF